MTGTTVWVVEEGEYSDYRVVGVFTSKENAQLIADTINGSGSDKYSKATLAEWPLDPVVDDIRQGHRPFLITMRRDGTTERCEPWEDIGGYEITDSLAVWQRSQAPVNKGRTDIQDCLNGTVWAKDETHAIKIANEHRTRLIATGEWPVTAD